MYIPRGKWYNFWNNELIEGEQEMWIDAELDSMPIFIKEGAIIPKYPIQQYVGEKEITQIELDVYFKEGKEKSEVYEDAHDGYDYKKGRFSLRNFTLVGKRDSLTIQQFKSGKYITPYETFEIKLIGIPFEIEKIEIDNEVFDLSNVTPDNIMIVSKEFTEIHIIGK